MLSQSPPSHKAEDVLVDDLTAHGGCSSAVDNFDDDGSGNQGIDELLQSAGAGSGGFAHSQAPLGRLAQSQAPTNQIAGGMPNPVKKEPEQSAESTGPVKKKPEQSAESTDPVKKEPLVERPDLSIASAFLK